MPDYYGGLSVPGPLGSASIYGPANPTRAGVLQGPSLYDPTPTYGYTAPRRSTALTPGIAPYRQVNEPDPVERMYQIGPSAPAAPMPRARPVPPSGGESVLNPPYRDVVFRGVPNVPATNPRARPVAPVTPAPVPRARPVGPYGDDYTGNMYDLNPPAAGRRPAAAAPSPRARPKGPNDQPAPRNARPLPKGNKVQAKPRARPDPQKEPKAFARYQLAMGNFTPQEAAQFEARQNRRNLQPTSDRYGPGARGAYGRPGSGAPVLRDPYISARAERQAPAPTPTGQVTWARDPVTGAYGQRAVLGSPQDEATYANKFTGGRSDSSFSQGLGAGTWR